MENQQAGVDPQQEEQHFEEEELEQEDQVEDEVSCWEKYKMTPQKIGKIVVLSLMLIIIGWFFLVGFENLMFEAKKITKIKPHHPIEQFAAPDEEGFRSYYFFKEMEAMAKDNFRTGKSLDFALAKNRFGQINFNELFGLFKVLKAIQHAKGYTPVSQNPVEEFNQTYDEEALSKPSNYTKYFQPVANQYQCASCYSFPITATVEYLYRKHFNISVKLSEQQLIDCSSQSQFIDGCKNGNITQGFQYVMSVGLVEQDAYPYRSKNGHSYPCRKEVVQNKDIKKYKIDGFRMLPQGNCVGIQYELSKGNTVAAMIAAGELNRYAESETAAFRNCPKQPFNHAITIVGQTEKKDWIVRNSWGASFGKNGYFTLKGGNTCGVCTHAIVPYFEKGKGKQGE